jgi:hypothetical protein
MTIPSHPSSISSSTPYSSLASTSEALKSALDNRPASTEQPQERATSVRQALPGGLVGHHVNTTA